MNGDDDLVAAGARNLATWQAASLLPNGHAVVEGGYRWAVALDEPSIFYSAITLADPPDPGGQSALLTELELCGADPDRSATVVCDSFARLDPPALGLTRRGTGWWMARPPGATPRDAVSGIALEGVVLRRLRTPDELARLESVAADAFGLETRPTRPLQLHPPALLEDRLIDLVGAWLDDELVGVAMACRAAQVVGVYGVAVDARHRGNGLGTALTRWLLDANADAVAVLQPTVDSLPLYERLGFERVGTYAVLHPRSPPA